MASGLTVGLRPSFSETFFHDALSTSTSPAIFFYLLPEKVDLMDLLSKPILLRFSERTQFVQGCLCNDDSSEVSQDVWDRRVEMRASSAVSVLLSTKKGRRSISTNLSSRRQLVYNASSPPLYPRQSVLFLRTWIGCLGSTLLHQISSRRMASSRCLFNIVFAYIQLTLKFLHAFPV
jgi:hypothetical protein